MKQSYAFRFTRLLSIVILLFLSSFKLDAQCEPVCKDNTDIYLCYESTIEVLPEDVLKPIHPDCLKDMLVEVFHDGNSIGNQVSYLLAGQTLDVSITNTTSLFTCQSTITIERDSTHPTAVCDEHTVTTLPSSGTAVLCADNFDSGSYDNCFLQSIKIRRMDGGPSFKDCIRVSCNDVGDPIMIVLQATDYEGLTDICMVELTVQEKLAPVIDCPDDIDISCKLDPFDVYVTGRATATDNCNVKEITHTDSDLRDDCGVGVIERTWTAIDDAGNISTCVQIIRTIWEREPLVFFPSDKVANCTEAYDFEFAGKPTTYDYCSRLSINFEDRLFRLDECSFKILRDWSVLDWCSLKEYQHTQVIKVFDDLGPTFTTPPGAFDSTYVCPEDIVLVTPEAVDDCSDVAIVTLDSDEIISGDCPNKFTRIISYLATDVCGNVSEPYVVTIIVNDTIAPTADALADLGPFPCYENIPDANPDDVTGEADNCIGIVTVDFVDDSPDPGCMGIVIRTYRLTDECGNFSDITQSIEIKDDINPTANPLPELGPFACHDNIPDADVNIVIASDNCGDPVMVFHIRDSPDPGCSGNVTRTYRIEDSCGNAVDIFQNIIINDDINPTAEALPDLGPFDCYEDRVDADPSIVSASDNCGLPVSVSFVNDSPDPGCMGVVTRTYQLEDACGNSSTITQNILIEDRVAPTADTLPNIGPFTCISDVPNPDPSIVTGEMDNCEGIVTVSFGSDSAPVSCQGFMERTYIITDECDNSSTVIQRIEINDDVMPTADPLDGIGPFPCLADAPDPDPSILTGVGDNCTMPTVTFIGDVGDAECSGVITRTYRITDECGNFIDISQHITILDEIPPVADPLPDMGLYSCIEDIPDPDPNIVTGASDNCGGNLTVTFLEDSDAPICEGIVVRTYRVADECGNFVDVTQNFSFKDTIPPTARAQELGPFACYEDVPEPDNQTIFDAVDNCVNHTIRVTHIGPDAGDPGCSGIVERLWRLRDECGNTSFLIQNVIIDDDVAPTADPIPDLNLTCLEDIPEPDIDVVENEADNCAGRVFVSFDKDIIISTCPDTIKRSYFVEDDCGNVLTLVQNIIVNDDIPPTADLLLDLGTFACYGDLPDPDINIITNAKDNCIEDVTIAYVRDSPDPGCTGTVTRTYSVTDRCGNRTEVTQTATINDNVPPDLVAPPDARVIAFPFAVNECDEFVPLMATATDNCGLPVTITNNSPVGPGTADASGAYPLGPITTFTYTAEDACGNSMIDVVNIEVIDTIPPTLSCRPAQTTIGTDLIATIVPDDIIFAGIAFDFCTPVTRELSQDTFTCADLGLNVVTLTVTDTFDNSSTCDNTIRVVDPMNLCGSPNPRNEVVIGGKIITPFYKDVSGVEVNLSGMSKTGMTDKNGTFIIEDVPMHNDYMVKPKKVDDYLNGVSTFDLVLLSQHILGTKPFDSPYQYIAGDVNNSGTISGSDIIQLRKLILNKIDAFDNNDSWRFIKYDYKFLNPENPLGEDLPEEKMIDNLSQSEYKNDFVAIKIGDINNDAKLNNFLGGKEGDQKFRVALGVEDQIFESGKEYEVDFRAKDLSRTLGYQFTLNFNEKVLEFIDLIPGNIENLSLDNFGLDYVYDGLVSTSFANMANTNIDQDEILFSIKFKVNAESRLSSLVKISSDLTTAEAYQSNAKDIDLLPIGISFENVTVSNPIIKTDFRLYQNRPNPFSNETIIGFDLPENASIVFSIFDISGRRIHSIKDSYPKGYNEIKLQDYQLNTSGIFYYRIDSPFGSITKKMSMIRTN